MIQPQLASEIKELITERLPDWIDQQPSFRESIARALRGKPGSPSVSFAEFVAWSDEDTLAEWVEGEVVMTSPASRRHQELVQFLAQLLETYVRHLDLGVVMSAPFLMRLATSAREPDVLYLAKDHLSRLGASYLDGPADLVVEVLSSESVGRDRGEKYYEYEAAGVAEYWLLDSDRHRVEFYQMTDSRSYRLVEAQDNGFYPSVAIPNFRLRVDWLWRDPAPLVEELMLEMGPESYADLLIEQLRKSGRLR